MKKLFLPIIGLFLFYQSCNKCNLLENAEINSELSWELKSSVELEDVNTSSKDILIVLMNESDNLISNYLYHIGLAIREMTKNPLFNQKVIEAAEKSDFSLCELDNLCNANTTMKSQINSLLKEKNYWASKQGVPPVTKTDISDIAKEMVYNHKGIRQVYVPCIFVYNSANLNQNLQPVISTGIPVDEEEYPECQDCYYFWVIQKDGSFAERVFSEEQANLLLNPIFVVDNGQKDASNLNINHPFSQINANVCNNTKELNVHDEWFTEDFRINYRYESIGNSEYTMLACTYFGGGWHEILEKSNGNSTEWLELASVSSNEIGTRLSSGLKHFANHSETGNVFFQTYERDWIKSKKYLGACKTTYSQHNFYGSVTYTSDWYGWDWYDDLPEIFLPVSGGSPSWSFDASKGWQYLWRI